MTTVAKDNTATLYFLSGAVDNPPLASFNRADLEELSYDGRVIEETEIQGLGTDSVPRSFAGLSLATLAALGSDTADEAARIGIPVKFYISTAGGGALGIRFSPESKAEILKAVGNPKSPIARILSNDLISAGDLADLSLALRSFALESSGGSSEASPSIDSIADSM